MSGGLVPLMDAKTILLTTYKRDGTPVQTPVSIAFDGDQAFFRSYDKAWKTKRLRGNPQVEAAPCTLLGKPAGPAVQARATLLHGEQAARAANLLGHFRERELLARIGGQSDFADAGQKIAKRRIAGEIGAQDQHVQEQADQVFLVDAMAIRDSRTDGDIVPACIALQ